MIKRKGAKYCGTCNKKLVELGGVIVHVETDGTIKLIEGHGPVKGDGR